MRLAAVIAAAVLLAGCATPVPTPSVVVDDSPGQARESSFEGAGDRASDPFGLAGGDYRLEWTGTAVDGHGCVLSIALKPIGHDELLAPDSLELVPDDDTVTGSQVVSIDGGRYAWSVSASGCSWSVTLTPIS